MQGWSMSDNGMKQLQKTSKNTFSAIECSSGHFRPSYWPLSFFSNAGKIHNFLQFLPKIQTFGEASRMIAMAIYCKTKASKI